LGGFGGLEGADGVALGFHRGGGEELDVEGGGGGGRADGGCKLGKVRKKKINKIKKKEKFEPLI